MNTFRHLHAAILRTPLYHIGARPDFRHPSSVFRLGLRAASPALLTAIEHAGEEPFEPKITRSLLRYQLRATGRCIPFGTFAGLRLLPASDSGACSVVIAAPDEQKIHAQLDAVRMAELYRASLSSAPGVLLKPNNTMYRVGRKVRYAMAINVPEGPHFDLSALDAEPYLSQILQHATDGITFEELVQYTIQLAGVPGEEAVDFLSTLVAEDVLIPDTEPTLTGSDPLRSLRSRLPNGDERSIDIGRLEQLLDRPGFDAARFAEVAEALDVLLRERATTGSDVQLDTYLQCECSAFSVRRMDQIAAEFEALLPLAAPYHMPAFEQFRSQFAKRYGTAAVPLLEALDPDLGIPYGDMGTAWIGPLVESLPVTAPAPAAHPTFVRAVNTMPVPVPLVSLTKSKPGATPSPDTMPSPASPDTMPAPVAPILVPDTMPGPAAPILVPNPNPGPVAPVRTPDTMPFVAPNDRAGISGGAQPVPDTMPAAPRPHVPDTMPGPIQVPDTMPGTPVIKPNPDTMPTPVEPAHSPDTMPAPQGLAARAGYPASSAAHSIQRLVQRKYLESIRSGAQEILLSDADLHDLNTTGAQFAKTFIVMGGMQNAGDDWRFAIDYAGGSTALSLLGRFANGDDAVRSLAAQIAAIEAEAEPEAIVAEIVHLPRPALGNVSRRPVLREAEIEYGSVSGAAPGARLEAADLMLQLHDGELCLFSRRSGRRAIPRLSTAHNFSSNVLPVYRFLCELQFQGLSQPACWDWGAFRDEDFLPAVRYGHLLLRRRSWKIPVAAVNDSSGQTFTALRHAWGIPDEVRCGGGDQQLRYDLRNPDEVSLLLSGLRNNTSLRIEDALAESTEPFVRDAAGRAFANEIIVPVVNTAYRSARAYPLLLADPAIRRTFQPSLGNWHYLRLYCGNAASDEMLREGLEDCVRVLRDREIISRWFFLRYDEGEPELRVRFCLRDTSRRSLMEGAIASWLQPFIESGSLKRIVVDTYERELERYGVDAIEDVELVFAADSECVAGFLRQGDSLPTETDRFVFAACAIDALFDDAAVEHQERIRILEPLANLFFREHGGTLPLQQSLNASYRSNRTLLEANLERYPDSWRALLEYRSIGNRNSFRQLQTRSGGRAAMLRKLPDLMHMQVNRTFQAGQRRYEMLIYHCLLRHYRSVEARYRAAGQHHR